MATEEQPVAENIESPEKKEIEVTFCFVVLSLTTQETHFWAKSLLNNVDALFKNEILSE